MSRIACFQQLLAGLNAEVVRHLLLALFDIVDDVATELRCKLAHAQSVIKRNAHASLLVLIRRLKPCILIVLAEFGVVRVQRLARRRVHLSNVMRAGACPSRALHLQDSLQAQVSLRISLRILRGFGHLNKIEDTEHEFLVAFFFDKELMLSVFNLVQLVRHVLIVVV